MPPVRSGLAEGHVEEGGIGRKLMCAEACVSLAVGENEGLDVALCCRLTLRSWVHFLVMRWLLRHLEEVGEDRTSALSAALQTA